MLEFLHKIALGLGFWIYPIVGVELFLESSAFLGIVLPGDTVVILMGILTGTHVTSLVVAIPLLLACVFLGDVSGYMLGRYKGEAILARSKWAKHHYERRSDRVIRYAQKWGIWIILIGRFTPFLRTVTPFTMGMTKMRWSRLVPAAAIASLSWCGGYFVLGYEFGSNWKELEPILAPAAGGVFGAAALAVGGWLCWHYWDWIKEHLLNLRARMRA